MNRGGCSDPSGDHERLAADERAATQRRIADAIRSILPERCEVARARIAYHCDAIARMGEMDFATSGAPAYPWIEALAAAAHDDAIWDALAQVRSVIMLERGR